MFLQFVQQDEPQIDLDGLARGAERHFDAKLSPGAVSPLGVRVQFASQPYGTVTFTLRARAATESDYARLEPAERANQSHGMAGLGRRCTSLWEVIPDPGTSSAACFYFGAVLASVALGPLLPPDGAGLYGVRSARVRAEALRGAGQSE